MATEKQGTEYRIAIESIPYLCCEHHMAVGESAEVVGQPSKNRYLIRTQYDSYHKVKRSTFLRLTKVRVLE